LGSWIASSGLRKLAEQVRVHGMTKMAVSDLIDPLTDLLGGEYAAIAAAP